MQRAVEGEGGARLPHLTADLTWPGTPGRQPGPKGQLQEQVPEATDRQASRALHTAIRKRLGEPTPRSGTAPNTHLVLSEDELAFIEECFEGSKSAAVHAALALLMQGRGGEEGDLLPRLEDRTTRRETTKADFL